MTLWNAFSREKMENVSVKMEMVAESISKVLCRHIKNQRCSIASNPSILCLRKYDSNDIQANQSENRHAKTLHSHALSLHISGDDHKFWIRSPGGSSCFELPAGSILVTIGRKLQVMWRHWLLISLFSRRSVIEGSGQGDIVAKFSLMRELSPTSGMEQWGIQECQWCDTFWVEWWS